ncbi:hypothetical protein BGZ98_002106 [Dissophora globulifera]|nr:hypothetical protein BGZ98_002106 [Dissophora globulifera]
MPDAPSSGRQRLKHCAQLIEHHLSDLQLIFDKDLLGLLGAEATDYIDLTYLQDVVPALADLTLAQLRRAIKYDAKDALELHPELDKVRRCHPFLEAEAVDRMLFVDDIDISEHEEDPEVIFRQLLLPHPNLATASSGQSDTQSYSPEASHASTLEYEAINQRTVIRPYGYSPTRFFQGFCYVEFASKELSVQMSGKILARNNSVRVMPM